VFFIAEIEAFFEGRAGDVRTLSENPTTVAAMKDLAAAFASLGAEGARSFYLDDRVTSDTDYSAAHARYHPVFTYYGEVYGYHNVFLVEPQSGYVVYAAAKTDEYGTSLLSGPYAENNLADVFKRTYRASDPGAVSLVDFQVHEHEHEYDEAEAVSFIASPIYDGDQLAGVLIFKLPVERLNHIMAERAGMGETEETYLVGADKLMRSDSRFATESIILQREVDTMCVKQALAGGTGTHIMTDYRGVAVLSAFQPLDIQDLDWVILAEIDKAEAFAPVRALLMALLGISGTTIVVVAVAAFLIVQRVSSPITTMVDAATRIAAGDLTRTVLVTTRNELGALAAAFNWMIENLRLMLGQIADTSQHLSASSEEMAAMVEQMNTTSEQIAVTVGQMAQGAATQARQAEEASHSMAQLAAATGQIADNTHQTDDASVQAQRLVQDSAQVVGTLGDKLGEIGRVVTLVEKIADQTNLLALNASIEAARAGEHGAGFAVVADEVRRLAEHSAASVGEIAVLSQEIASRLEQVLAAMEEVQKGVAHTVSLAQQTGAATQQQERTSEAMVGAVNEMATVAEENAAANEEIAAAIEQQVASMEQVAESTQALAEVASSLQQTVSGFRTGDGQETLPNTERAAD